MISPRILVIFGKDKLINEDKVENVKVMGFMITSHVNVIV